MTAQLDLFGTAAPSPARRPARPDTALLLAMSGDHTRAQQSPAPPAVTPATSYKRATIQRAERALAMFIGERPGMGTRKLDNCFEMFDGEEVAAIICERLRSSPQLARAVLYGKAWVRDCGERYEVWADRYLTTPMKAAIAEALGEG